MRARNKDNLLPSTSGKLLLSVDEAAALLSLGRSAVYSLLMRNEIVSIKVGRTRRIPMGALQDFVARQAAVSARGI